MVHIGIRSDSKLWKSEGYLHFIENAQLSVIDLQINVHEFVQFTYGPSYR